MTGDLPDHQAIPACFTTGVFSSMSGSIFEVLDRSHRDGGFSGVCLVTRGDDIVVHQGVGLADRGFGVPNAPEVRYDIASITKLFTAAAIMQLVDRGAVSLETQVMPFLGIGDTRISDNVTVFHCLTPTSGIADDADEEAGESYELLFVDKPNYSIRETRDFLPQFAWKAPVFAPGQGVRYNNCAYVLLGLIIEKATGLAYRDYVRQHIFAPAGMTGADFCAMDGTCPNMAEHYARTDKGWRKNIYSYPPVGSPDGGATATALDLDRFLKSLRENRLMSDPATRQLLRPHIHRRDIES